MSRHLMAKMRNPRTAKHFEEPPHEPHDEWRVVPNYRDPENRTDLTPNMKAQVIHEWRPPYGESLIEYQIHPRQAHDGSGDATGKWYAMHHGLNRGMKTIEDRDGNTLTHNDYDFMQDDNIGEFDDPHEARAAVEAYHAERYGKPGHGMGDYDINQIMRDEGF